LNGQFVFASKLKEFKRRSKNSKKAAWKVSHRKTIMVISAEMSES